MEFALESGLSLEAVRSEQSVPVLRIAIVNRIALAQLTLEEFKNTIFSPAIVPFHRIPAYRKIGSQE